MSTKITIREITLTPETDVEEFEKFVSEEASTFDWEKGISHRFIKYDSGIERSPYILIFESSEEIVNLQGGHEKLQAERNEANPHNQVILDKLNSYIVNWGNAEGISTSYFSMD